MERAAKSKIKRAIKSGKIYKAKKYKEWRAKVFKRDRYACQLCKKVGGYIEAHHIKLKSIYPELVYRANNGITLCGKCHKKIHREDTHKEHASEFRKLAKENKPKPRMMRRR